MSQGESGRITVYLTHKAAEAAKAERAVIAPNVADLGKIATALGKELPDGPISLLVKYDSGHTPDDPAYSLPGRRKPYIRGHDAPLGVDRKGLKGHTIIELTAHRDDRPHRSDWNTSEMPRETARQLLGPERKELRKSSRWASFLGFVAGAGAMAVGAGIAIQQRDPETASEALSLMPAAGMVGALSAYAGRYVVGTIGLARRIRQVPKSLRVLDWSTLITPTAALRPAAHTTHQELQTSRPAIEAGPSQPSLPAVPETPVAPAADPGEARTVQFPVIPPESPNNYPPTPPTAG